MGDVFTPKTLREITDALGISRRYTELQLLSGAGFGYIVAKIVCNQCGNREIAQGRKFADGLLYFLVPEPEGGRTRGMLVARKVRTGGRFPVDRTFIAYLLDEIPTDVPTILQCPKHGKRSVDSLLILNAISEGKPTYPRVVGV